MTSTDLNVGTQGAQDVTTTEAAAEAANQDTLSAYTGQSIEDMMALAQQTQSYMLSQQMKLQIMNAEMSMMAKEIQAIKVPQ